MTEEISTSTSVDVLIERLKTHPDEFYNRTAISSYDGEKVFAGVKWRRVIVTLMTDTPPTAKDNLWLNLFSEDEKQRFRAAMYETLRGELDGQIMRAMVTGHALDYDEEREMQKAQHSLHQQIQALKASSLQSFANQQAMGIANTQASSNSVLTTGYGGLMGGSGGVSSLSSGYASGIDSRGLPVKQSGMLESIKSYLKEWDRE